jgi:hypothetical protein
MTDSFDPYEHLLRNFSKHKFKVFVEELILNLSTYPHGQLPEYGSVRKDHWDSSDYAYMDMPTGMSILFGITSYNRWYFLLDHIEDGMTREDAVFESAKRRLFETSKRFASDSTMLSDLKNTLEDRIGGPVDTTGPLYHRPLYGSAILHYLTNVNLNPYENQEFTDEFLGNLSNDIYTVFLENGKAIGTDLSKVHFGCGLGSPRIFLTESRDKSVEVISKVEARPDSIHLQFLEGRVRIFSSNKRMFHVYDEQSPKLILMDQTVDPKLCSLQEEIEELEDLLNDPKVREVKQLQKFFERHPWFLMSTDYDQLRPQISLEDESGKELRPDFFLKPIDKVLWEILDLKLPTVPLIAGSDNREDLSYQLHRGISQLMNYSKFFDNPRNREKVFRATGIDCFKPRLTLVIGKKGNIDEALWNRIIDQERPFVQILGYDELLSRSKSTMIKFLAK